MAFLAQYSRNFGAYEDILAVSERYLDLILEDVRGIELEFTVLEVSLERRMKVEITPVLLYMIENKHGHQTLNRLFSIIYMYSARVLTDIRRVFVSIVDVVDNTLFV